ncbi:MAG: RNA polymerase sigma factor [Anaerovoracaceae bacterium]
MGNNENIELFEKYITENQNKFYRLTYSYIHDKDTSLDLVQEAIISGLKSVNKLREPQYLNTWFYRILVNTCLSYLRQNKKHETLELLEDTIETKDSCFDEIKKKEILRVVMSLEPDLKTVIFLKYYEEMTFEEISSVTKINVNTVKSRLYKALEILKEKLGDYYDESRC